MHSSIKIYVACDVLFNEVDFPFSTDFPSNSSSSINIASDRMQSSVSLPTTPLAGSSQNSHDFLSAGSSQPSYGSTLILSEIPCADISLYQSIVFTSQAYDNSLLGDPPNHNAESLAVTQTQGVQPSSLPK